MTRRRTGVSRLAVAPAAAFAVALALAGCGTSGSTAIPGAGTVVRVAPADRTTGPALEGDKLGGGRLTVASYRGRVVVLNVWASWCGPCRAETPALEKSQRELAKEHVAFVGLNTQDSSDAAQAFERAAGATYPSLYDPNGSLQLTLRHSIPPSAIPSTLVLDPQGRVAAGIIGPVTQQGLSSLVGEVLLEGARASATASPAPSVTTTS